MAERDDLCGRTVGEFVLREKIGEGGFGAVYRCEQPLLGRAAVIKVLHHRLRNNDTVLQRFLREAQLASRLDHPYAAHVYAFGVEDDGLFWIAMEMVQGIGLDRWLRDKGPLGLEQFVPFFERVCEVVQTAHERGIVHRDLKPANVMVIERAGRLLPKLLDFGIAKLLDKVEGDPLANATPTDVPVRKRRASVVPGDDATLDAPTPTPAPPSKKLQSEIATIAAADATPVPSTGTPLTRADATIGSPPYMSPEQWNDPLAVGPGSDLYALGVVAYECITGTRPFMGTTLAMFADLHSHADVPPVGPKFPPAIDAYFKLAMAKRVEDRPATALQLAAQLRVAAGFAQSPTDLPKLEEAVRDAWLAEAPQPLAEGVAALEGARNAHQARDAARELFRALMRYLLAVALAARAQVRTERDDPQLLDLLRTLHQRELGEDERVRLLRLAVRPFIDRAAAYPVPELVAVVTPHQTIADMPADDMLDPMLSLRTTSDHTGSEDAVVGQLAQILPALSKLLRATSFVLDHALVAERAGTIERWTGLRRAKRPLVAVEMREVVEDRPLLVKNGKPTVLLWPLVQLLEPTPGKDREVFVFDGRGRHGARLIASPAGYEHHSTEFWEWLGDHVIGDPVVPSELSQDGRLPYLGLSAFSPEDADRFVGREREIDDFVNRLRDRSLQVVVGPSGAGKSSFVHAGVVPALSKEWPIVTMRPGAAPHATLTAKLATQPSTGPIVVIVDQLEEMFTVCSSREERENFAAELAKLATKREEARVICTVRDDFLMRVEELPALRALLSPSLFLVGNPSRIDLIRTIVEPAQRAGYDLSDGELAGEMVDAVADRRGALALLSFTSSRLWELRDRRFRHLTRNAYGAMGGVKGALVQHAESTLEALTSDEQRVARDVFRHLVTAEGTRAAMTTDELKHRLATPRADHVIEKLVGARLLAAAEIDGAARVEIIHEALIEAWPRLHGWVREDPEGARMREQLRAATKQWLERSRNRSLLWRDDLLGELERWRKRPDAALSSLEEEFADDSRREAQRTRRTRRRILAAGFAALAVTSVVMFGLRHDAVNERSLAEQRKRDMQTQLVKSYVDQARTKLIDGRRWEALAKVVAAQQLGANGPVIDTMRALARTPARGLALRIAANSGRTWSVAYSPDGRILATSGEDGAALWDAKTGALRMRLGGHQTSVRDVSFDPTGARVATIGYDGTLRVYTTASGEQLQQIATKNAIVRCVAWHPAGKILATAGDTGTIEIWDSTTGANRFTTSAEDHSAVTTCAFGHDLLAFATTSGKIGVVVPETGVTRPIGHNDAWTRSVQLDANDARLVTASHDKTVRVWDVATARELLQVPAVGEQIYATFSPDGTRIVSSGRDGVPRMWDATSGKLLATLVGHHGTVWFSEFSRDGTHMLTTGDDGIVRVWDVATAMPIATLEGHSAAVLRAHFSPDGTQLASASYDGTVAVWNWRAAALASGLRATEPNCALASSLDRAWIATACPTRTRVWNAAAQTWLPDLPGATLATATATRATLATGTQLRMFELPSGRVIAERTLGSSIRSIAAGADRVAVVEDNAIEVFSNDGQPRPTLATPSAIAVVVLPGDTTIVVDGTSVRSYVGSTQRDSSPISRTDQDVIGVASATGGNVIVVGLKDLWLWDPALGKLVALSGHQAPTIDASFDATGTRLVSTSQDGSAIVWDVAKRTVVRRLVSKSQYLSRAVFDPTGRSVVALDGSGQLQIFDVDSGDLIGEVDGVLTWPRTLHVASDDTYSAFDQTGTLATWHLQPDRDPLTAATADLACKAPPNETVGTCPK